MHNESQIFDCIKLGGIEYHYTRCEVSIVCTVLLT